MKNTITLLFVSIFACFSNLNAQNNSEISTIENGLFKNIQIKGETIQKYSIYERMEHYKVPGVSIAIVENGQLKWAKGYGLANTKTETPVNENTLFQAASISKPLTALAALKLYEEGSLDLDTDVNNYLKDWKIPENKFTETEKVTIKRLLTHTAGTTVHGFPGYKQKDDFPTIIDVLNGNGNTPKIFVDTTPGSIWRYSGGGYTIMEKVLEDVSGLPLEEYMFKNILSPLQMNNSTYAQPLSPEFHQNASAAYNWKGKLIKGLWHNYPEQAAAGLWTTPSDLAKYCIEIQEIMDGKQDGILTQKTVETMLTKDKNGWGLGPGLRYENDSLIFGHGGKNAGFTNDFHASVYNGNAVIIMTNADNGGQLIAEIQNAIADYYDWEFSKHRTIETVELDDAALNQFVGKYRQVNQKSKVKIKVKDDILNIIVFGRTIKLTPMSNTKFIDLDSGNYAEFVLEGGEVTGFLINGRIEFVKL